MACWSQNKHISQIDIINFNLPDEKDEDESFQIELDFNLGAIKTR